MNLYDVIPMKPLDLILGKKSSNEGPTQNLSVGCKQIVRKCINVKNINSKAVLFKILLTLEKLLSTKSVPCGATNKVMWCDLHAKTWLNLLINLFI